MKRVNTVLVCLVVHLILNLIVCDICWKINARQLPYYKLIKSNARSNQLILSRTMVESVNECRRFAAEKKALSFNYSLHTDLYGKNIHSKNINKARNTCLALQCPELHNFTTLIKDKNYKYYSAYPNHIITETNFTLNCIPRTGIFVFSSSNLNYSQAQIACQKMNASLAHIVSEKRTNQLAKFISLNTTTFVGLSTHNTNTIWKNEFGESLSCFDYRAWGKGEPSCSKGCVGLVQPPKPEPGPFWRVVPCHTELPFICEVSPMYILSSI